MKTFGQDALVDAQPLENHWEIKDSEAKAFAVQQFVNKSKDL